VSQPGGRVGAPRCSPAARPRAAHTAGGRAGCDVRAAPGPPARWPRERTSRSATSAGASVRRGAPGATSAWRSKPLIRAPLPCPTPPGRRAASFLIGSVGSSSVIKTPISASSRSMSPRRSRTSCALSFPDLTEKMICLVFSPEGSQSLLVRARASANLRAGWWGLSSIRSDLPATLRERGWSRGKSSSNTAARRIKCPQSIFGRSCSGRISRNRESPKRKSLSDGREGSLRG